MNKQLRKISIVYLAGVLSFAACHNEGSSTVGTYDRDEEPSEKEGTAKQESEGENNKNPEKFYIDSSKSVDSSLRKKDAGASPEKNSVNMPSKAAPGKIQPGDTQQQ